MGGGDEAVDRLSDWFAGMSEKARGRGGVVGKAAPLLADDADFVRKLKPSLVKARAKGENPAAPPTALSAAAEGRPGGAALEPSTPNSRSGARTGPNPLLIFALAAAVGILLARLLDWSGHAHPRG
jgi:hypothetical protein